MSCAPLEEQIKTMQGEHQEIATYKRKDVPHKLLLSTSKNKTVLLLRDRLWIVGSCRCWRKALHCIVWEDWGSIYAFVTSQSPLKPFQTFHPQSLYSGRRDDEWQSVRTFVVWHIHNVQLCWTLVAYFNSANSLCLRRIEPEITLEFAWKKLVGRTIDYREHWLLHTLFRLGHL